MGEESFRRGEARRCDALGGAEAAVRRSRTGPDLDHALARRRVVAAHFEPRHSFVSGNADPKLQQVARDYRPAQLEGAHGGERDLLAQDVAEGPLGQGEVGNAG